MKKQLALAAFALSAFAAPTVASAATCVDQFNCTFTPGDDAFTTSGDTTFPITGIVTADIGRSGIGTGIFTDTYAFIVDVNGLGSGSFSTSLSSDQTNINFISATINGFTIPITGQNTDNENGALSRFGIKAGELNTLVLNFESFGAGSYGGNLTFTPTATAVVPEPATWAMMFLGFGLVGAGMRRRRSMVRFA
jgi:hypothetical protein